MKVEDFNQPIIFLLVITVGVVAMMSIISWILASLGWTGPLGIFKGGVMMGNSNAGGTQ
jgi:hypothetical protein